MNGKDDRGKFGANAEEMVFIRYPSTSKEFRVYNRMTHEVLEGINVSFDEKGEMAPESTSSGPVLTGVRISE